MVNQLQNRHIVVRSKVDDRFLAVVDIDGDSSTAQLSIEQILELVQPNYNIPIKLEETKVNG